MVSSVYTFHTIYPNLLDCQLICCIFNCSFLIWVLCNPLCQIIICRHLGFLTVQQYNILLVIQKVKHNQLLFYLSKPNLAIILFYRCLGIHGRANSKHADSVSVSHILLYFSDYVRIYLLYLMSNYAGIFLLRLGRVKRIVKGFLVAEKMDFI